MGGAAAAAVATSSAVGTVFIPSPGRPVLRTYQDSLPDRAGIGLGTQARADIRQFGRVLETDRKVLITVDRSTWRATAEGGAPRPVVLDGVWDVASLGDGSLVVATTNDGVIETDEEFALKRTLIAHDPFRTVTRVAVSGDVWVAYDATSRQLITEGRKTWATLESIGLQSVRDIVGLGDGRFVVADSLGAALVLTDGRKHETLARYRNERKEPIAPAALIMDRDDVLWVRTMHPVRTSWSLRG
jgi:hypothetical protein